MEKDKKYQILNFTYTSTDKSDMKYKFESYDYEHKYIISKSSYQDGLKYLNEEISKPPYIYIYYKLDKIINNIEKDYVLVNEKFLNDLECEDDLLGHFVVYLESGGKHFIYTEDNKILEIIDKNFVENKDNNICKSEEEQSEEEEEKDKKNIKSKKKGKKNKDDDNSEENKLKSLILLYAYEKHIQKLLDSPIVDEYEFKDYYLIDMDFIIKYQNDNDYKKLCDILETKNYNYSYNGFIYNLNEIMKINELSDLEIKQKIYKEYDFIAVADKIGWFRKNDKECLNKFIFLPENLFDLLFKSIEKKDYSKEDYKYKILIGDKTLFIQGEENKNEFSAYRYEKRGFELFYYFKFDCESSFYEKVDKYIKGKGLLNYVIEKNLDIKKSKVKILKDEEDHNIGEYKNIKEINNSEINELKNIKKLNKLKKICYSNNYFINYLLSLQENDIDISDINNICQAINRKELSCIKTGIILDIDLINLKKKFFFNEINELYLYEGTEEYENKKKSLINKLSEINQKDFKNVNIYDPESLKNDESKKNDYNLINNDINNLISDSKKDENLEDCYYFKNKGEYFIIFAERKILYKINYNKQGDNFKLEEDIINNNNSTDKNSEKKKKICGNILDNIKELEENTKKIREKIKSKFENILSKDEYYLVSSKWIEEFKKHFKEEKKNFKLSKFLSNKDNLKPKDIQNEMNYNHKIPGEFDIIKKKLFESILKNINSLNENLELKSDYLYKVSFGGNSIFIKKEKTDRVFIYSLDEEKYNLEYIIKLKDIKTKELFKDIKNFQCFLNKYQLSLTTRKKQDIKINKNNNKEEKIGEFTCINPKEEEEKKEGDKKEETNEKVEKDKKKRKTRKPTTQGPVHCLGLENIGATCYMNATIQCLCHVAKFKDFFLNGPMINEITLNKNCPLTLEFSSLVNHLWKYPKDNQNKDYYKPSDFKNIISQMNPLFAGIAANDSKDLIIFIYETIHSEINIIPENFIAYNLNNCFNNMDLVNFRNSYYNINSSIVVDTFYFEQQTLLRCEHCKFEKLSYSIINMLVFPLEKVRQYIYQNSNGQNNSVSLDDCFIHNKTGEILNGENQIYCNNCRSLSDATTVNEIFTAPEVFTIILNRGKGLEFNVNFSFNHYMDLSNYVIDKSSGKSLLYELIGILCHYGPSGMSGHFIAFCKSPEDHCWYCYNDATVTKCEGDPDISKYGNVDGIPYVLYYQRYENQEEKNKNCMKDNMKNFMKEHQINNNLNNITNNNSNDNSNNNNFNNNNFNFNANNNLNNNVNNNLNNNNFNFNSNNNMNNKTNNNFNNNVNINMNNNTNNNFNNNNLTLNNNINNNFSNISNNNFNNNFNSFNIGNNNNYNNFNNIPNYNFNNNNSNNNYNNNININNNFDTNNYNNNFNNNTNNNVINNYNNFNNNINNNFNTNNYNNNTNNNYNNYNNNININYNNNNTNNNYNNYNNNYNNNNFQNNGNNNYNNNYNNNEDAQCNNSENNHELNNNNKNNNKGKICLHFKYNDKIYDFSAERNVKIQNMFKKFYKKYEEIPGNVMLLHENNNMAQLDLDSKINETNLNDDDFIVIIPLN